MGRRELVKRAIAWGYSVTAARLYEPIVVKGAFRLFGGELDALVLSQWRRAVASASGRPILDMPVGTAYFTVQAARLHDALVVGADIAAGMVRRARRAGELAGARNLAAVQADAHALPFRDGCFGAVLCSNGLQVIPGIESTLAELARVGAPGSALFVSAVTVPASVVLPDGMAVHLPVLLRSPRHVEEALLRAGYEIASRHRSRLALLLEARRPTGRA